MRKLDVSIEMEGRQREVGQIIGTSDYNASFSYSEDYLASEFARPISLSLPLRDDAYDPETTKKFFEGLLPEGFLRRTIAENNRTDQSDYLTLLEMLGSECLGAIQIKGEHFRAARPEYRPIEPEMMYRIAAEGALTSADLVVESHLSLTGASGKIGAYRSPDGEWYLPVGSAPSTHILKQSHIRYDHIIQNELLALRTASKMGIDVPASEMVRAGDDGEELLFATKRYDRSMRDTVQVVDDLPCPLRLHQEDFGQALGIAPADKYERGGEQHMAKMFGLLRKYSASPIEDQMKLWDMIVFHYLIGNTDGHIKNFSILYDRNLKSIRLTQAYDIISTIVYDTHSQEMAFAIGGEINWFRLDRDCFVRAADEIGLSRKIFMERFDRLDGMFKAALAEAAAELESEGVAGAHDLAEKILGKRTN